MAQAAIEARDLVVRYGGSETVNVRSLKLLEQEILAVMGPNGAGKSTLLRILGFLEPPTGGDVIFQGGKVGYGARDRLALHRRTAVVFQEPLLLNTTVFRNVALGLRLRGIHEREETVREWLERFGIAHLGDRSARTLSGGEAQRANLARAFVLDPEVLLLDEPFSSLDPPTREALLADLKSILSETRTSTVFVTHDRDEALALGDRVAVMMEGRIRQLDAPERVFSSPASEEIARFVGVETILPGHVVSTSEGMVTVAVDGQRVDVVGDAVPGEQTLVCIRPEDVILSKAEIGPSSVRNHLEGTLARAIPLGPYVRIVLNGSAPIVASITKQSFRDMDLHEGDRIIASFKATAAHLIPRPGPPAQDPA